MCGTPFWDYSNLSRLVISKKFIILDWIGLLYLVLSKKVLLLRANVVNTVNMRCVLMAFNVKYNELCNCLIHSLKTNKIAIKCIRKT